MQYLTMSQLCHLGRGANQFFRYAFLTGYAKQYGLELQLPRWVGNTLFGTTEPLVSQNLPIWKEYGGGLIYPKPPKGNEVVGHDFWGYAQYHTSYYASDKKRIRALFQPVASVLSRVAPAAAELRSIGRTVVGIHIRRGDYGRRIFPLIPISWYLNWLEKYWHRLDAPVLFIATEDLSLVEDFEQYAPQTATTLGINLSKKPMEHCAYLLRDIHTKESHQMDWYPDFYLLSQCNVVLGPSSTFSFFAAMLNPCLRQYWRASLAAEAFRQEDPWNADPVLREHVKDFPHLAGIVCSRSNPYW